LKIHTNTFRKIITSFGIEEVSLGVLMRDVGLVSQF